MTDSPATPRAAARRSDQRVQDLVALAGASRATASSAPADNPLIPARTRERIAALAHSAGYVANPPARGLRTGRTGVFGVMVPLGHAPAQA